MVSSERTPEEEASRCPVCGSEVKLPPSVAAGDTPCPRCGHLLWFTWESLGDVDVIKPIAELLTRESLDAFLDSVAIRPGIHLVLDLANVHYFASAALARMIGIKNRVHGVGGRFSIRNVGAELQEIFRITNLEHVFEMEPRRSAP